MQEAKVPKREASQLRPGGLGAWNSTFLWWDPSRCCVPVPILVKAVGEEPGVQGTDPLLQTILLPRNLSIPYQRLINAFRDQTPVWCERPLVDTYGTEGK